MGNTRRTSDRSSGFKSVKQVGVAVSIGFPLVVVGVLALALLLVSLVGTATAIWIICGVVLAIGLAASVSGRVV
jgi:hypothetical protein